MKLFSRKALVAGAASIALMTGAGATASAAESTPTTVTASTTATTDKANSGLSSSEDGKKVDTKEIRDWIGIITAIIGALTTAFTFAQRFLK